MTAALTICWLIIQVSGAETTGTGIGGDIKTNSFGGVFALWPDTGSSNLFVAKSTDGGANFSVPVTITTTFDSYDIGIPNFAFRRALIYITGGAYRTPTKNLVFAVWTDLTGATGCNSTANEPGTSVSSTCKTRIWFARSVDGGTTWQAPSMINNQASLNDRFNPWFAVDDTNGTLVVIYYDTVNDPGRLRTDVWAQISNDDGVTWSPAKKLTSAQTDETVTGADIPGGGFFGDQYGDYNGLSGYMGRFFPSWTDRRTGGREEIWTAKIPMTITQIKARIETGNKDPGRNTRVYLGFEGKNGREFRMRTTDDANPFRKSTSKDVIFGTGSNVRDKNINDPTNPPMDETEITGAYIRIEPRQEEPWKIIGAQVFINGRENPAFSLKLTSIVLEEDASEKISLG